MGFAKAGVPLEELLRLTSRKGQDNSGPRKVSITATFLPRINLVKEQEAVGPCLSAAGIFLHLSE